MPIALSFYKFETDFRQDQKVLVWSKYFWTVQKSVFNAEFCSLTHVQKHLDQKKDGALVPLEAGECNSAIPFLCVYRPSFSLRVILVMD
jgi:hypothetical protein